MKRHGTGLTWLVVLTIALALVWQLAGPAGGVGKAVYAALDAPPDRVSAAVASPAAQPGDAAGMDSDVQQHRAHAHLEVGGGTAHVTAHFANPDGEATIAGIIWYLKGWNRGLGDKDLLDSGRVAASGEVDLDVSVPVPAYDYYLLECRNMARPPGGMWETVLSSESRYSLLAPYNGIWERTGEVTSDRAVLHTYLSEKRAGNATGEAPHRVPPMAGSGRFIVYSDPGLTEVVADSGFLPVDDYVYDASSETWRRTGYSLRWTVTGLTPDSPYWYQVETMSSDGLRLRTASNVNSFRTAPLADANSTVAFVVVTGVDHVNTCYDPPELGETLGLKTFSSMLRYRSKKPDFAIMTGDTVYYDGGVLSPDVGYTDDEYLWRWHFWYAQYRLANFLRFFREIPGYWMVDDHDYSHNNVNDPWPDGWHIFRNVNPTPGSCGTVGDDAETYYDDNPYGTSQGSGTKYWRTLRWGRHLELFIEEGRNHRDGSADLIWGEEQQAWLEARILESDATFKILVATTPLLGPTRHTEAPQREDKHAESRFRPETESFLYAIKDVPNVFIVNGDRHYKYHSVINAENYPELAHFNEFSAGAAAGGTHAQDPGLLENEWARTLFADGANGTGKSAGYLRVEVRPRLDRVELRFELIAVTEEAYNELLYSQVFTASPGNAVSHVSLPMGLSR